MTRSFVVKMTDTMLKPGKWYDISELSLTGFCFIGTKEEQNLAGYLPQSTSLGDSPKKIRRFGPNPIKPYRDYYGSFTLTTRLLPEPVKVLFALGYTINSKIMTIDDLSNFGWLRLATERAGMIYPNLADHEQLLRYLKSSTALPVFLLARIYHHLHTELYQRITEEIKKRETPA